MLTYILTILIASGAIVVGNHIFMAGELTLAANIFGVAVSVVAVITLDGILAAVCHKMQGSLIKPDNRYFAVSKRQKHLLEMLGVKRFKEFLPDLGTLVKFPKGTIADPYNKDYIYRYIQESCTGEVNHVLSMFFGFAIIFLFKLELILCFGVPVAIVNAILNLLPAMSLRYNRSRLVQLYEKIERRQSIMQEQEQEQAEQDPNTEGLAVES